MGSERALRAALVGCWLAAAPLAAPLAAQGVDPRGDWRTLETAHFHVHFPRAL